MFFAMLVGPSKVRMYSQDKELICTLKYVGSAADR